MERNAITELMLETWHDYVNSIDDDEHIIDHARAANENARAAVDAWIDEILDVENHYTLTGRLISQPLVIQIADVALRELDHAAIADAIIGDARDAMDRIPDACMYLVDGHHGIYSGQYLVECWSSNLYADAEDIEVLLSGPDHEHDDAYLNVLDAGMIHDGYDYHLYSGDGIWAVRADLAFLLPDGWPF